ncbi:MAG TPA: c-type cytochrome [Geobacteraceae bacterium]|nr:c-type cytochrome [Geobacteraceae bacterium]
MKHTAAVFLALAATTLMAAPVFAGGGDIFKAKCSACHPDGGNIMKKDKTLHRKDREANKLKGVNDLVKYMRAPGPGMPKFDAKALPDKDAREVAEYIMKTFK